MKKWFALLLLAIVGQAAFAQDTIVKRNSDEITAKVLSVSPTEIEYRKFDNPDGPIYKLPISEVFYIKYQNGTKDVFAEILPQNPKLATGPGPVVQQSEAANRQYYGYGDYTEEDLSSRNLIHRPRFTHQTERYPYYQGEITAAYGVGVGLISKIVNLDRVVVETVHGVRINPYFFVGSGIGFNYFYSLESMLFEQQSDFGRDHVGAGIIPVFANLKSYYPCNRKFAFYLSLDLGTAIPATGLARGYSPEFYTAIGPGINFGNGKNHSHGDFSIRYQHLGIGLNAVLFRIGYGF